MIRLATRHDIPVILDLLVDFMQEGAYGEHAQEPDREYLRRLIFNVIYVGYIWLWTEGDDAEPAGFLAAYKEPNIWQPNRHQLRELAWYVRPEYRGRMAGGRLFIEFCRKGEELMTAGTIHGYATTRMTTTNELDLERRGFRLTEYMYLKD